MRHTLFIALLFVGLTGRAHAIFTATAQVPVTDVWSRPLAPGENPVDDLRETQLLFGERVLIHDSSGAWVRIEAVEQPEFTHHNTWEGYPGWVQAQALGPPKDPPTQRQRRLPSRIKILKSASRYLGKAYVWGGLSDQGLDCSGLVHVAYRLNAMTIPRDSHEQWMKAKPVKRAQLRRADLIFSAKTDHPQKVTHVTLYAGDGQIIEAPQTGMTVRQISFKEKYGADFSAVESGQAVGDRVIYFGSYWP